ncbi:IreB family regulatory phosphoprotein [Inediibacterium massiliense]|uniref:IreB family regulatory phosphoprotein n=1 Tax=Inediibacterium massiliense TaxID=1658111 RepID=UPI0006B5B7E5|nr:IreB family regulatory phosphoprotein [Inediibacterium massiliense]
MYDPSNYTMKFNVEKENINEAEEILKSVYQSLKEKGYNPINQLVGYILSGDPTYITSYNNARSLIRKLERDELLEELLKNYLEKQ